MFTSMCMSKDVIGLPFFAVLYFSAADMTPASCLAQDKIALLFC
jgi:hypothetical protein